MRRHSLASAISVAFEYGKVDLPVRFRDILQGLRQRLCYLPAGREQPSHGMENAEEHPIVVGAAKLHVEVKILPQVLPGRIMEALHLRQGVAEGSEASFVDSLCGLGRDGGF